MKNKRTTLFYSVISLVLCVSMLVGTTFAWFTDNVSSGINTIASGYLDVELYHSNAAVSNERVTSTTQLFMDLQGKPILWEPGAVSFENLRVANEGDLALTYQLTMTTANENFVLDPTSGAQYGLSQILKVGFVPGGIEASDRAGVVASVEAANWTTMSTFLRSGSLLPAGEQNTEETWGIVIYWEPGENDNLWNLNNGKTLSSGDVLSIDLGIQLIATQKDDESDGFGSEYDKSAAAEFFPGFQGGYASAAVSADDEGLTTAEVKMDGGDVAAVIPAGVRVAQGVSALPMSVALKNTSDANIQLGTSDEMRPLDVHIEGVAADNTVPMLITLKHYMSTGINTGALRLYHVENGETVAMTQVANPVNHNEFSYDPYTGDVTLALASFSEVAVVADTNNPWDGETRDYSWYTNAVVPADGESTTVYTIANADQLAGFADIVDGKAEGIAQDSFAGKTVKLNNNITLSGKLFDPIGWGYVATQWNRDGVAGKVFKGTFDGGQYDEKGNVVGRYTIFDLYQSGWDLEEKTGTDYTYTNCGFGLFAAASGATFKNLTISGAYVRVECVEAGVLVGLSQNNCTYENIKILDSKVANYQRPAGGLIGEVSGTGTTTISNVVIGDDVVVGSLWGDFDAPVGGVIGARWDDVGANPQIVMSNVDVGCRLDVYNDITSAYQWHAYRRAGMLIGNTDLTDPENAHKAYAKSFLKCENVKVYYGDWVNYTYCEFSNYNERYPWVRTQAGENCTAFSNPRWGVPNDAEGNRVTDMNHVHADGNECNVLRQFSQLYGGGQGVYGQDKHDGVEVVNSYYSITYVNDSKVLDIIYVTNNSVAFKVENDQAEKLVLEWAEDNIQGGTIAFGGWMNAASIKLTEIPKDNTKNVVLYPYFNSPYTASFVDQQGNILSWCLFNDADVTRLGTAFATAKENLPDPGEDFELINWQIRGTDKNDKKITATLAVNNTSWESFKGYKDVTITPHYRYQGAELIEVYDELTGEIDHYQVAGYGAAGKSTVVEIPDYVNGIPVTTVNADAFSSYDDLHSVRIPGTITEINSQAFTANQGSSWNPKRDTITMYYEGDPAVWNAEMEKYEANHNYNGLLKPSWDNMMGDGSRVFFLDANGKVINTMYWELNEDFDWVLHEHAYSYDAAKTCAHGEKSHYEYGGGFIGIGSSLQKDKFTNYAGACDCDSCDGKTRPDAQYWN